MLRAQDGDPARDEMIHVLCGIDLHYALNPADPALGEWLQHTLDKVAERDCGRFLDALMRTHLSGALIDVVQ